MCQSIFLFGATWNEISLQCAPESVRSGKVYWVWKGKSWQQIFQARSQDRVMAEFWIIGAQVAFIFTSNSFERKFLLKNSWAKIFHFDSNCCVVIKCWLNANLIVIIYLHGCNYGGGGKCSDGQIGGLRDEGTAPICAGHWSEAKEEEQTIKSI